VPELLELAPATQKPRMRSAKRSVWEDDVSERINPLIDLQRKRLVKGVCR